MLCVKSHRFSATASAFKLPTCIWHCCWEWLRLILPRSSASEN